MRGREFIMKDAYSFDRDEAGADKSYWAMYDAYQQVFKRLGLRFRAVEADSGSIGGSFSHEFMVLADTGEDTIAACTACEYAANVERAEVAAPPAPSALPAIGAIEEVPTPGKHTVEDVCAFLKLNDVKLKNLLKCDELDLAAPELMQQVTNAPVGFAGPVGLNVERVFADHELLAADGWITGANKGDAHLRNVSLPRDAKIERYADLRVITPADACPRCGGAIELTRGIEVGHVFKLGTKYSEPLKCTFLDEDGKEKVMVMGCYGIGVSRVVASCIEQNHDADGIVFPPPIAPYEAVLCCLDPKNGETLGKAEEFYTELKAQGVDVILDDRDERPGVKFKDADLVGMPLQLVVGGKGLARGIVEAKDRRTGEKTELPVDGFAEAFRAWRAAVRAGWGL